MAVQRSPLLSLITPTANRAVLLPLAYRFLCAFELPDWEWIVLDDGREACEPLAAIGDERVRYRRLAPGLSMGAKRNEAAAMARGTFVLHVDDDDYYAPGYPARLLACLERGAGLAKLGSWLAYAVASATLGWVDTARFDGPLWELSGRAVRRVTGRTAGTAAGPDEVVVQTPEVGWGFSFAYRRETWQACQFPDTDWNEDGLFATEVTRRWGLAVVAPDPRLALHLVHPTAVSASFACRLLRPGAVRRLFPPAVGELIRTAAALGGSRAYVGRSGSGTGG